MIEKKIEVEMLELENFLSIEKTKIDLGKLTVLVGPNASGKSNIIKALMLLSGLAKSGNLSIEEICENYLGINSVKEVIYNFKKDRFRLKAYFKFRDVDLSYEVSVDSTGRVLKEEIRLGKTPSLIRKETEVEYQTLEERKKTRISNVYGSILPKIKDLRPKVLQPIEEVADILGNINAYSFDPYKIRARASSSYKLELRRDGSNLAQVLHSLLTYDRKKFLRIEETLKDLIPEVDELNTPITTDGAYCFLSFKEKGVSEPLKYTNISDGTLRILAFVTALHLGGTIVAFEEPENCVHPYLFETIVDLSRKAPCQVLITTHSPYLVDEALPEELRFVDKINGKTRVRMVEDKEKVKKMLEEGLKLGEIWFSRGVI